MGDGFLLFGDFQRLDRHGHLARLAVEQGDAGVDLFADGEAVGALVGAVARQFVALDEGLQVGADDLHFETAVLDLEDFAGDDGALLQFAIFAASRAPA